MKRNYYLLLLTIFLSCFTSISNAQKIAYGGKLGVNFSKQTGNAGFYENVDFKHGYHLEGFIDFKIAKRVSLQIEAAYSQKGYLYNNTIQSVEITEEGSFNYFTAPLLLKYSYGKKIRFFAVGGAYASMLLNAETEYKQSISASVISDVNADYKGFDYGIILGSGIGFRTGKKIYIFFETRYEYGLAGIDDLSGITNVRNQTFATSIGMIYYY